MPDPQLKDQTARDQIGPWRENGLPPLDAFERDTNFVVRAAAGSGKTTALVGRMVALVRTGTPVEHIAAITFTKKAAGEMQARFYRELMNARAAVEAGRAEAARLQRALDHLPNSFIGTIHSFCQELLRARPEAADVAKGFTVLEEEQEEEELRDRFWQAYLSRSWTARRDALDALIEAGVDVRELTAFFGALADAPELEPFVDGPEAPPALEEAVEQAKAFHAQWMPYVPGTLPNVSRPCKTAQAFKNAARYLSVRDLDTRAEQADFLKLFAGLTKDDTRSGTDTKIRGDVTRSHWNEHNDIAARLDDELLAPLVTDVVAPNLQRWKAYVHRRIVAFVRPAVRAYRQQRWANGRLTFSDLLVAARNLLRDRPALRARFQQQYRHVLVDEFQDTDPIQAEVLFYLTGQHIHETDWRQCVPESGRLFIVGDDKQSIYGFRQADMTVFNEVGQLIDDQEHGETVNLVSNFRSAARICAWCDEAFGTRFDDAPDDAKQAAYVPFEPTRSVPAFWAPVRQLSVPYEKGASSATAIARRNAEQIARFIASAWMQEDPLLRGDDAKPLIEGVPEDFMILTRNTTRLSIYAEALAERNIPYTVAGGNDGGLSEELQGLVDLLTCVFRPDDSVARVAYLRGPLVGLSDDGLYRLKQAYETTKEGDPFAGAFRLPEQVAEWLDPERCEHVDAAYAMLRTAQRLLEFERPAAAVASIVDRVGGMARALQHSTLDSLQAGRLQRILAEVQHMDAQGQHWSEVLETLEALLNGETTIDGMTLETGQSNSVRLLNIHKAKGLQANVVFLADPKGGVRPPASHVHRQAGTRQLVRPVLEWEYSASVKYGPAAWTDRFEERAEREQAAEEDRLRYVAATRAKRLLVVSRYQNRSGTDKGFWAPLAPYLDDHNVPELTAPSSEDSIARSKAEPVAASLPGLSARAMRRRRVLQAGAQVSYRAVAMSEEAHGEPRRFARPFRGGDGVDFGRAVHAVLEVVNTHRRRTVQRPVVETLVEQHLGGADPETVERVLGIVGAWTASPLWEQHCASPVAYAEVPVAVFASDEESMLRRGIIDLVYQTPEGWVIVDFKTDRIASEEALRQRVDHYAPQIQAYAEAWRKQAGAPVHRGGLWFTDREAWQPVKKDIRL